MKNLEEIITDSPLMVANFQAVKNGSEDPDIYRDIAQESAKILDRVGNDTAYFTASIFLSACKARAESAVKALLDIQRQAIREALDADRSVLIKNYAEAMVVHKKQFESTKKSLRVGLQRDLDQVADRYRTDYPVRVC